MDEADSFITDRQRRQMMRLWNGRVGMITSSDVVAALGNNRRDANALLSCMCKDGYVERVDTGVYHWSPSEDE